MAKCECCGEREANTVLGGDARELAKAHPWECDE